MLNEDFARTAVVVGSNYRIVLKLLHEPGGTLIRYVEILLQHGGGDGIACADVAHGIVVEHITLLRLCGQFRGCGGGLPWLTSGCDLCACWLWSRRGAKIVTALRAEIRVAVQRLAAAGACDDVRQDLA